MELAERYFQLSLLGRETFLDAVALGALVRVPARPSRRLARGSEAGHRPSPDPGMLAATRRRLEIFPLAKKPGGAFVDIVTVGRTAQNDVQIEDLSVSRFHAFFRRRYATWLVCDAGSSNGTRIDGTLLPPRTERELSSGSRVRIGTVDLTFYVADALYDVLSAPA